VDHRADVYSFGIMVHEVLTGQVPFDGEAVMDILVKQTSMPPPPMSSVNPAVSPELDAPVLQMLEKDPAKRPASIGVAMEALIAAATRAGFSSSGLHSGPHSLVAPHHGTDAHRAYAASAANSKTLSAGALETASKSRRTTLVAGASVAVVIVAVGVVVALSRSASVPIDREATALGASEPSAVAPVTPVVVAVVAPSSRPTGSAISANGDVELTVETNVNSGVEVWLGAKKIGTTPDSVKLPRGATKLTVTLKAPGYSPVDVDFTPSASGTISATMIKLAPAAPSHVKPTTPTGPATPTEIESPF
jgi:serine/threonine-protein kinase